MPPAGWVRTPEYIKHMRWVVDNPGVEAPDPAKRRLAEIYQSHPLKFLEMLERGENRFKERADRRYEKVKCATKEPEVVEEPPQDNLARELLRRAGET